MNKIISVAYYEIIKNIRDIKMLILLILTPIILIFILGKSLDAFLTLQYMPTPVVGYVNEDSSNTSDSLDTFLNQDEIKSLLTIKNYETKALAEQAVENNEISSYIHINSNYTEDKTIEVLGKKNLTYVETIVKNYVNTYNLNAAILINGFIPSESSSLSIERGELNPSGNYPDSMDYYAVQTMLQVLMLCGVFGIAIVLRDYSDGLLTRVKSLPIQKYQLIIGRLIGAIMYSFISAIITILFSKFVFQANWDGNPILIGFATLLFVVIVIGIGVLLASITRNYMTSFGILALLAVAFPAAVGAFSPKSTVKPIAIITPNHYTKNIIFGAIYDYPKGVILNGFIGLIVIIVIVYGLVIFFEGRRKYENL